MTTLMRLALQWVFAAVGALAVGPVAGWLTSLHRGIDGSGEATMLVGSSVATGVLGHAGALALAVVFGVIAARAAGGRFGLFASGVVLAWGAARSGRVERVLAAELDSGGGGGADDADGGGGGSGGVRSGSGVGGVPGRASRAAGVVRAGAER